jgi:hypothetical protein
MYKGDSAKMGSNVVGASHELMMVTTMGMW